MLWKTLCQECGSLVSLFWGDEELQNMRLRAAPPFTLRRAQGTQTVLHDMYDSDHHTMPDSAWRWILVASKNITHKSQNGHFWYFCWDRFREKFYQISTENAQAGKVRGTIPSDYETPYQVRREWLGDFLEIWINATWAVKKKGPLVGCLEYIYRAWNPTMSYPVMWRWFPKALQGSLFFTTRIQWKVSGRVFSWLTWAGYMF